MKFMQRRTITVPASAIPSNRYSVCIQELLFKDRRETRKRMPDSETDLGYTFEEVLLSMSMLSLETEDGEVHKLPSAPSDPIINIRRMPNRDAQTLLGIFLSMFTITNEEVQTARNLGEKFLESPSTNYVIPKESLPMKSFSVTFSAPCVGRRADSDRAYPGENSGCGYSKDELYFVNSITHIDGEPVNAKGIYVVDDWPHKDFQYCFTVFANLCYITREQENEARNVGKQLLESMIAGSTTLTTTPTP
jgi:hypothetical protein